MAAFIYTRVGDDNEDEFHIGEGVADRIKEINHHRRTLIIQVDGDELDAVLWGLENFQKGS